MTPEELWLEAIQGNQRAWSDLYQQFGGRLYQFFLKNTCNPELSMDKAQEVFERLYRRKEAFQGGSLKAWIFHIAKNLLIDEWRKKKRLDVPSECAAEVADASVHVEEAVVEKLDREQMVRLLDTTLPELSDQDRILIGLIYLGGVSIPEVAQIMELPLGTAKTQVRQARLRLDRKMTEKLQGKAVGAVA